MEIIEITSLQNNLVKFCTKLQNAKFRKAEKLILLDGEKTIQGIIQDNIEFEYLFIKKDSSLKEYSKIKNLVFVTDEILKKISTTATSSSCVGIIKEPEIDANNILNCKKIAILENIKDAGNLGTIIRSAVAFSIDAIVLYGNCVDLYNSKTIRATAQNMFKIPIIHIKNFDFIKKLKKNHKFLATVVNTENNFFTYQFEENIVLLFGSEADGLSKEMQEISDVKLTLPMDKNVESINLAICASIAFALTKKSI